MKMPLISITYFMTPVWMITEWGRPRKRAGGQAEGGFGFEKCVQSQLVEGTHGCLVLKDPANPSL